MNHATITRPPYRPPSGVHLRSGLVALPLLGMLLLGGGAYWYFTPRGQQTPRQVVGADTTGWPAWMNQRAAYEPEKPAPPPPVPLVRDEGALRDAELMRQLQALKAEIEALKKQKPAAAAPPAPAKSVPKTKYAEPLFLARAENKEGLPQAPEELTYLLAPGDTKIPCTVETAMSSEIPNIFTAKVRVNVYDSKTRTKVLIPQNSTILGEYKSGDLLYGNTRIPTVGLSVALPNGESVALGDAPVTDQLGMAGLTGDVNHHFWRNLSAVLILGVLRSGTQAIQVNAPGAAGIAQSTSQYGQQLVGRAIDTRPTITIEGGQLCTVILTKPLQLPAYY